MDVYHAVTSRRSIRRFQDRAVPYAVLEKCVNAARLAPSARNRQLCEYIIVDDDRLLPRVFDCITTWAGQPKPKGATPAGAPKAYLVTLINTTREAEAGSRRQVTIYDVGMAAENMILVALEEGIGSCPILSFQEEELKQLLQVPDNYDIALVLALGYPDESPVVGTTTGGTQYWVDSQGRRHVPKRKLEDILHHNTVEQG